MASATPELFLVKTQQGVTATRAGEGLSPSAHEVLKKFDGTRSRAELKFQCKDAGIAEADFEAALKELMKFDFVREMDSAAAIAASLARAEAERRMLQTLDFTATDEPEPPPAPPKPAAAKSAPTAAPVPRATPALSAAPAAPVVPQVQVTTDNKAEQLKRENDIRQKLIAALRPKIEEELRGRLRPKLEEEIRPKLIAALRPSIEAEVRRSLEKELAPRVELELKTRFAKSLAAQRAVEPAKPEPASQPEPAAPVVPDVPDTPGIGERVLGALATPVFCVDMAGVCQYLSPAWSQFSGYEVAETVGQPLTQFFDSAGQRVMAALLTSVAQGKAFRFEQQGLMNRKGAEPLWVEMSAWPLHGVGGKPEGVGGMMRDVSEQRRVTAQAEADSVRLLLMVDQIDTGVLLEDAEGHVQQVNPALCGLLALDAAPSSLAGTPVMELFEQISAGLISPEGFLKRVSELRQSGEDVKAESFVMRDGRVVEQDYLAVTVEEGVAGRIWIYREMKRQS